MFNTLHTVCFMHGLSIYEIKRICHRAYFTAHDLKLLRKCACSLVIPCCDKILHDIFWQFVEKMEFVFRINHALKNLILKILKIYF